MKYTISRRLDFNNNNSCFVQHLFIIREVCEHTRLRMFGSNTEISHWQKPKYLFRNLVISGLQAKRKTRTLVCYDMIINCIIILFQ